ncbi:hypothetical protein TIFTF001_041267 [Ficus carica]|uniref:Uncharacterized protein n=1 Tax=Ficus carica TaxID=3494 RepID=A0AA87Z3P2_FICCA|nr:hypothetical protein TIFTF001_041267 [Ficus carica]
MRTPLTPEVLCLRAWRTSFMYAFWTISLRNSPPMTHRVESPAPKREGKQKRESEKGTKSKVSALVLS